MSGDGSELATKKSSTSANEKPEYDTFGYTVAAGIVTFCVILMTYISGVTLLSVGFGVFMLYLTSLLDAFCSANVLEMVRLFLWAVCWCPFVAMCVTMVWNLITTIKAADFSMEFFQKTRELLWKMKIIVFRRDCGRFDITDRLNALFLFLMGLCGIFMFVIVIVLLLIVGMDVSSYVTAMGLVYGAMHFFPMMIQMLDSWYLTIRQIVYYWQLIRKDRISNLDSESASYSDSDSASAGEVIYKPRKKPSRCCDSKAFRRKPAGLLEKGDAGDRIWTPFRFLFTSYTSWMRFVKPIDDYPKTHPKRDWHYWMKWLCFLLLCGTIACDILLTNAQTEDVEAIGGDAVKQVKSMLEVRLLLYIYMLPILIRYNIAELIWRLRQQDIEYSIAELTDSDPSPRDQKLSILFEIPGETPKKKNSKMIRWISRGSVIATLVLGGISILAFIIGSIAVAVFDPRVLHEYPIIPFDVKEVVTAMPSAQCSVNILGWDILDLAKMLTLAHIDDDNEALLYNVTQELFGTTDFDIKPLPGELTPGYSIEKPAENSSVVLVLDGIRQTRQIGYLLENVALYYSNKIFSTVVPMFNLIYDVCYGNVNYGTQNIFNMFIGSRPTSRLVSFDINNIMKASINQSEALPLVIGHMSGGMTAKYASLKYGVHSVAFESPKIMTSLMNGMAVEVKVAETFAEMKEAFEDYDTVNVGKIVAQHRDKMYNYFSSSSFFSFIEEETAANTHLPTYQSLWKPANVYETFCVIAAGCTTTNEFDRFCGRMVGDDTYRSYFDKWNRTRI